MSIKGKVTFTKTDVPVLVESEPLILILHFFYASTTESFLL